MYSSSRHNWLRHRLAPERLPHIVDVGANPAEPVAYADLLNDGGCHLTGFEPQRHAFEKLQKTKGPHETYHQFAVGDGQVHRLNFMAHDTMTSFFKGDDASVKYLKRFGQSLEIKSSEDLQTVALDQSDVPDFDLLKIDIQGGENIVFDGANDKLSRAVAVIPEVRWYRLYEGEPMFAGVDQALRRRGFALHRFLFNKSHVLPTSQLARMSHAANANQLIDGDAVYIRDMANLKAYTGEALKHLAILADAIWFSFDLVVRCLDLLIQNNRIPADSATLYVDQLPAEFLKSPALAGQP